MKFHRFVIGREALRFQGICMPDDLCDKFDERFLHDLAGNAFSTTTCSAAVLTSLLVLAGLWNIAVGNESNDDTSTTLGGSVSGDVEMGDATLATSDGEPADGAKRANLGWIESLI